MICNLTRRTYLAEHPRWALTPWERLRGMIGRRFVPGEFDAMVFERCSSIHSCWMGIPIDAVFLALEQIAGKHYELDEFQIRSITEGREAMGETVVRLMSDGKLYSGRGLSTDVLASSIQAYLSALNKIVYEEKEE